MTEKGMRVLVIEDDPQIRKLLKVSLRAYGYDIDEAVTGQDGINRASIFNPDLIILDLGLPDIDGKNVVQQIREWSQVPVIILTARDQEAEKVKTLDAGADDYITKPFGVSELMARMRVSLRRATHSEKELILTCGELVVDVTQRRVSVGGREVKLTPTEYTILKELIQNAGKVITHKQLLVKIWGKYHTEDTHYVRIFISQLRHKIEEKPAQPRYIISEPGIGYRLMCK